MNGFVSVTANFGTAGNVKVARQADLQSGTNSAYSAAAGVSADITAALANGTISGDETALGLVTTIQTDFNALVASLAVAANTSDVLVSYLPGAVDSKNNLRSALAAIMAVIDAADDLE